MDSALRHRRDHRNGGEPIHAPRARRYAFWATGLILFSSGSSAVCPVRLGRAINPSDVGLDAAAPTVFLALLWPSLRRREARWVALGGAAVALALVPLTPPGIPVIAAASVALVAGLP